MRLCVKSPARKQPSGAFVSQFDRLLSPHSSRSNVIRRLRKVPSSRHCRDRYAPRQDRLDRHARHPEQVPHPCVEQLAVAAHPADSFTRHVQDAGHLRHRACDAARNRTLGASPAETHSGGCGPATVRAGTLPVCSRSLEGRHDRTLCQGRDGKGSRSDTEDRLTLGYNVFNAGSA